MTPFRVMPLTSHQSGRAKETSWMNDEASSKISQLCFHVFPPHQWFNVYNCWLVWVKNVLLHYIVSNNKVVDSTLYKVMAEDRKTRPLYKGIVLWGQWEVTGRSMWDKNIWSISVWFLCNHLSSQKKYKQPTCTHICKYTHTGVLQCRPGLLWTPLQRVQTLIQ